MGDPLAAPGAMDALADVEFLARSENRVRVLSELASGPATRDEIRERTGINRVTLGRILSDFEERGWIERAGVECRTTPVGQLLARAFADVLESFATARQLADVAEWLPTDLGLDVERLADATVTVSDRVDPMAALRRSHQRLADASELSLLTDALTPEALRLLTDRVCGGELRLELVAQADALASAVDSPERAEQVASLAGDDRAAVHRHGGDVPFVLAVSESGVDLGLSDERGMPTALVETDDPDVREWAVDTVAEYRRAADPVSVDQLPVDPAEDASD